MPGISLRLSCGPSALELAVEHLAEVLVEGKSAAGRFQVEGFEYAAGEGSNLPVPVAAMNPLTSQQQDRVVGLPVARGRPRRQHHVGNRSQRCDQRRDGVGRPVRGVVSMAQVLHSLVEGRACRFDFRAVVSEGLNPTQIANHRGQFGKGVGVCSVTEPLQQSPRRHADERESFEHLRGLANPPRSRA
jgi:hypothetical protein